MNEQLETGFKLESGELVTVLKAAAEPTRLRIMALLNSGELNVKDLMQILHQSQPRLSRHLKLLFEAGLLERFRDGSWVYFRLSERARHGRLGERIVSLVDPDDPLIARDRERFQALKQEREALAQAYFEEHASEWDRIRALHVAEDEVEAAVLAAAGDDRVELLVDLGTGTGKILHLFSDRYQRGVGFDVNQSMLAYARAKLESAGVEQAEVRFGDLYNVALDDATADIVVMHQLLHFLADPAGAIDEAARLLKPGGRLIIVDFAPHELEFLRTTYAHERLGFADEQIGSWLSASGLQTSACRELRPAEAGEDQLTVMVWVASKPARASRARRRQGTGAAPSELLEEI